MAVVYVWCFIHKYLIQSGKHKLVLVVTKKSKKQNEILQKITSQYLSSRKFLVFDLKGRDHDPGMRIVFFWQKGENWKDS